MRRTGSFRVPDPSRQTGRHRPAEAPSERGGPASRGGDPDMDDLIER